MELNEIAVFKPSSASVCPVCSCEVRMYYVNFNEKVEMCGNFECDYPFGYVPLKFVTSNLEFQGLENKSVKGNLTDTKSSIASTLGLSDVEKMCNIFGNNGIPGLNLNRIIHSKPVEKTEKEKNIEEIERNVQKIKEMTESHNDNNKRRTIKNKRWLQNLSFLQQLSGVNLVKPEEMQKINKRKCSVSTGELKIDINQNSASTIKIEINH